MLKNGHLKVTCNLFLAFVDNLLKLSVPLSLCQTVAAANDVDGVSEGNKVSPHILIEFGNQVAVFKCNIFCANEFKKLRDAVYPLGEEK